MTSKTVRTQNLVHLIDAPDKQTDQTKQKKEECRTQDKSYVSWPWLLRHEDERMPSRLAAAALLYEGFQFEGPRELSMGVSRGGPQG